MLAEEKKRRDMLSEQYLGMVEKERMYYKMAKEFEEECRKNESLLEKCAELNIEVEEEGVEE